jgi:hypothetical protein
MHGGPAGEMHVRAPFRHYLVFHVLQERRARRGDLVTRITVTSSIFNFSTRFFAQIVENRKTQLSSPFLGPGDYFSKSYDENQIWCAPARAARETLAGSIPTIMHQIPRARFSARATSPDLVFVITFRKIVPRT